ncbi:uncharacterized protein LOC124812594 [Hydra vulgaris]|uniref:uncharacterized protein LOC124812594 n=1 Tax=Hydra vulgaris TaxID=6087 RepID=UPI0032E9BE7A
MEPEQERLVEEFSKESFMQEVQKYPVLYDKFNAEFKNNIMKKNAWAAIGVLFGLTDQECESKYKNIRSWLNVYIDHRDTTTNVENKATTTELTTESPLSYIDSNDSMDYDEDVSNKIELENKNLSENTNYFLPDENSKMQDAIISTMNNINATLAVITHEENDDIIHFCKSICATIKRLPPKTQAVAKINIQQYLAALEFPDIVD